MSDNQPLLERYINEDGQPRFTCRVAVNSIAENPFAIMRSLEGQVRSLEEVIGSNPTGSGREAITDVVQQCSDFFEDANKSVPKPDSRSHGRNKRKETGFEVVEERERKQMQSSQAVGHDPISHSGMTGERFFKAN